MKGTGWTSEDFQDHREDLRKRKQATNDRNLDSLLQLRSEGFRIHKLNTNSYRINERLDVFTSSGKWFDVKTGKRGVAPNRDVVSFVKGFNFVA